MVVYLCIGVLLPLHNNFFDRLMTMMGKQFLKQAIGDNRLGTTGSKESGGRG